eukprot:Nk52_evm14s2391 gene=Nk52_evmTU14s2391
MFKTPFKAYYRFVLAICVVFLESFSHLVFILTPTWLVRGLDWIKVKTVGRTIRWFRSYGGNPEDNESPVYDMTTTEMCRFYGYPVEEHIVITEDGYILTLHRIPRGKQRSASMGLIRSATSDRPAVFIQHGLLQNSEVWVTHKDSLAFQLADAGYDVWMGNNRGNRYSCKHIKLKTSEYAFWNFSLDEYAMFDVPANLKYVMSKAQKDSVSYVGFSQGTAQAFAAFSTDPELAEKVNLFVALAPAARAKGLNSWFLKSFLDCAPDSFFLIFGHKAILPSALFWRNITSRSFFVRLIDGSVYLLFGWDSSSMSIERKKVLYAHLYSYTSVKTIVHWFQIVSGNRFQMYDEDFTGNAVKYHGAAPPLYPVSQMKCPVAMFYGGKDQLPDFEWLMSQLPRGTYIQKVDDYEHLCFMWADSAPEKVFTKVISLLNKANGKK